MGRRKFGEMRGGLEIRRKEEKVAEGKKGNRKIGNERRMENKRENEEKETGNEKRMGE